MKNHFDTNLNLRSMIEEIKPSHVVECGALKGENTVNLVSLMPTYIQSLTVISDDAKSHSMNKNVTYIKGISYIEFEKLPNESIDLCIIDTDHNYWTIQKELVAVHPKMKHGGYVVMHDVDTFYYDTGVSNSFGVDVDYPKEFIESIGRVRGGLGMGVLDFLTTNRFNFKLIKWIPDSCGVAVIQKTPPTLTLNFLTAVGSQEAVNA